MLKSTNSERRKKKKYVMNAKTKILFSQKNEILLTAALLQIQKDQFII